MLAKIIEFITGLNPRIILAVIILVLCGWAYMYVHGLQSTITEQQTHIITLQEKLTNVNSAVKGLGTEKVILESKLNDVKISNGHLTNENARLNEFIANQIPAKDCTEALSRISNNAEQLAKSWNGVKK